MIKLINKIITLSLFVCCLSSVSRAEEINYTRISETFFPETKHWQTVESAPVIEKGKFTEIKGQLKTTFLASRIFEKLEEKDCSFITRALEEGNINSFRLIDVDSDGIKDIVYTGSAQCREGDVFLIWFATKNGFEVRQDILWEAKALKIYPGEKVQLSSVAAGCCANPVDEYNLGNLNNIRFIKRVSTTFMTIQPTGTLISRPRFKNSKDTVLRSSPERKDSYDESLSGLQNRAVFGNVLSEAKGTLMKMMKIITLHPLVIVVERICASASEIRRTWDPSPCDGRGN